MAKERILQEAVSNEVRRKILREFLNRYRNELMDDEERMLPIERIRRLHSVPGVLARQDGGGVGYLA
jgi:hypothetical protein